MSRRKRRVIVKGAVRGGRKYVAKWQRPDYESDYKKPEPDAADRWIAEHEFKPNFKKDKK